MMTFCQNENRALTPT